MPVEMTRTAKSNKLKLELGRKDTLKPGIYTLSTDVWLVRSKSHI
jgi:hypothetical protein